MKLVVMIPAFNEERNIGEVIKEIPRAIENVDEIEIIVIDDGSTDNTARVSADAGATQVINHKVNKGLGIAFKTGIDYALTQGADIIVNIDADGQYNPGEIPKLIRPILKDNADLVLTDRRVLSLDHMPFTKKYGNVIATAITRFVSGFPVKDAQSGFRAFSREAALRLNIQSEYTYVQETIIQSAIKKFNIIQMTCEFRPRVGDSRLISNIFDYAKRAGLILVRTYVRYKPMRLFSTVGTFLFIVGVLFGLRFLFFFINGLGSGHIQSLILSAILLIVGFQIIIMALIADTIYANKKTEEEILYRLKKMAGK